MTRPTVPPVPKHWVKYLSDVDTVPKDDCGHDIVYRSPGPAGQAYWIASYGADGRPGGNGYDADIIIQPDGTSRR